MGITVGVVGTGNMGSALVRGWLRSPDPQIDLLVYDIVQERAGDLGDAQGVTVAASLEDLAKRSDVLMVVVKPKDVVAVLKALRPTVTEGKTVVSSAAGITLDSMRAALGPAPALFRIMPNLGVELGEGVLALSPEPGVASDAIGALSRLFACMGVVEVVPEDTLDAVAAVAGSSVGFLALALEAMEDGAVRVGMPRASARTFVRQTALATALLLQRHPGSAADLKDQVASPGGTTMAGLAVLEDQGVRGAFMRAIEEATERGRQMRDGK
ncbi:MAG: pyrroline-5-carboxylate reductase [bacterium]